MSRTDSLYRRRARVPGAWRRPALALAAVLAVVSATGVAVADPFHGGDAVYKQHNLVSDIGGVARVTDRNLQNPWGMAALPNGPLWIADNNSNVSTIYTGGVNGSIPQVAGLVVQIPGGNPDGIVANSTTGFVVTSPAGTSPAKFIFDSESGQLTAWNGGTQAAIEYNNPNAVYKGLTMATTSQGTFLYAADFSDNAIHVFDSNFKTVSEPPGAFTDPNLPAGYAPFGIQEIDGFIVVTYALQDAAKHDDVAGPGHGFVDVYDADGTHLRRLVTGGALNSPWGLALAPFGFGAFGGDLLVGNFGDGTIHAYNPFNGDLEGELTNPDGNPIQIDQLWGLRFGNGVTGSPDSLLFTAGIGDELHGLFGEITVAR